MSSDNIQFGHFKILKTLGKGSSASVKLAENLETNEFVALKILKLGRLDRFNAEVDSLTRITAHPNVVQVFGTTAKATYQRKNKPPIDVAYIEMEYCAKGELFDFLYNLHAFPESVAKRCTREIALGLEKVHQQNLAHRDLKPENILITSTYQLKISDFGFATLVLSDGSKHLRSFRGTRGYMAPEILKKEAYQGHQTDVFSLGVVIFILFTGRPPFTSAEVNNSFYRYIQADRWSDFWSRNEHIPGTPNFSPEFKDLMQHMLCVRPTDRLSCAQVLEHAWLTTGVCENEEMVDWLSRHIVPEIITPHSNTEDSSYRTLQLTWQGSSDTSCEGDEPGLFRYSSRVPVPFSAQKLTAFFSDMNPDRLFEALAANITAYGGIVRKHPILYKLKARVPGRTDCMELVCCISAEECKARVEFIRYDGDQFEFYELIRTVMKVFSDQE